MNQKQNPMEEDNRDPYAWLLWEEYCDKCKADKNPPYWEGFQEYAAQSMKQLEKFCSD